jgi:hypothetical protein
VGRNSTLVPTIPLHGATFWDRYPRWTFCHRCPGPGTYAPMGLPARVRKPGTGSEFQGQWTYRGRRQFSQRGHPSGETGAKLGCNGVHAGRHLHGPSVNLVAEVLAAVGIEAFAHFADLTKIELLVIDESMELRDFAKEMKWNQATTASHTGSIRPPADPARSKLDPRFAWALSRPRAGALRSAIAVAVLALR